MLAQAGSFSRGEDWQLNFIQEPILTTVLGPVLAAAATLFVKSTVGYAPSGTIFLGAGLIGSTIVGGTPVTYTGLTDESFTGCTGVIATNDGSAVVQQPNITGWTLVLSLKYKQTDVVPAVQVTGTLVDGPNGRAKFPVPASTTALLVVGPMFADVWRTDPGTAWWLAAGVVTVLQSTRVA